MVLVPLIKTPKQVGELKARVEKLEEEVSKLVFNKPVEIDDLKARIEKLEKKWASWYQKLYGELLGLVHR